MFNILLCKVNYSLYLQQLNYWWNLESHNRLIDKKVEFWWLKDMYVCMYVSADEQNAQEILIRCHWLELWEEVSFAKANSEANAMWSLPHFCKNHYIMSVKHTINVICSFKKKSPKIIYKMIDFSSGFSLNCCNNDCIPFYSNNTL